MFFTNTYFTNRAQKRIGTLTLWKFVKLSFFIIWFFSLSLKPDYSGQTTGPWAPVAWIPISAFSKTEFRHQSQFARETETPEILFYFRRQSLLQPPYLSKTLLHLKGLSIRKKNFVICNYSFFSSEIWLKRTTKVGLHHISNFTSVQFPHLHQIHYSRWSREGEMEGGRTMEFKILLMEKFTSWSSGSSAVGAGRVVR